MIASGINVDFFYTYGSPRVGDDAYSKWFAGFYHGFKARITHSHDPVPHLPLSNMGFHHSNTEVFYPNSKSFKICDETGEDGSCSNNNWTDLNILDHSTYMGYDMTVKMLLC